MVLRVSITVGALAWLLSRSDAAAVLEALKTPPLYVVATPFVALLGTAALHATRLHLLLAAAGTPVPWAAVLSVWLRAAFVGAVSPRGGADVARVAWLSKAAGSVEPVVAAAVVARLLDLVPWLGMLLWGLLSGALDAHPPLKASATLFAGLFAFSLVGTTLIAALGEPLARRLPVFRERAVTLARSMRRLGGHKGTLGTVALLGLGVGALNVLSVYVVARSLGAHLPVTEAIGVVPAMDTVISLPVTISGVGLREGVFVLTFGPRGLDQDAAVAAAWIRWSGELGRALVGGALFALGGRLASTKSGQSRSRGGEDTDRPPSTAPPPRKEDAP